MGQQLVVRRDVNIASSTASVYWTISECELWGFRQLLDILRDSIKAMTSPNRSVYMAYDLRQGRLLHYHASLSGTHIPRYLLHTSAVRLCAQVTV